MLNPDFQPEYNVLHLSHATGRTWLNGELLTDEEFGREHKRMLRKYPATPTQNNEYCMFWIYPAEHYTTVLQANTIHTLFGSLSPA